MEKRNIFKIFLVLRFMIHDVNYAFYYLVY